MTNPSISYGHGYLTDCNDLWNPTVYTAGAGCAVGHTHCAVLTQGDDWWNGCYIKYLTGLNAGEYRLVTDFTDAGDTLDHAVFANIPASGDTFVLSNWFLSDSGLGGVLTQVNDDVFEIASTPNAAGNEYTTWEYPNPQGTTHLNLSSAVYTTYYARYKASGTLTVGVGARVELTFLAGGTQYIVGDAAPALTNNKWVVATGAILNDATHDVIEHVRIIADDNPDATAAGNYVTSFDYILLCEGTFTFPNCEHSRWEPNPKYAIISYPIRGGDDTQNTGSKNAQFHCTCNLDLSNATDDWRRPQGNLVKTGGDVISGQIFDEIAHRSYTEPWQWLDTGNRQLKVVLENPAFIYEGEKHTVDLVFTEKRASSATTETYIERFGLNL